MKDKTFTEEIIDELKAIADIEKKKDLMRFFKTGIGEYGEGDEFLGVKVPEQRKICRKYFKEARFPDLAELMTSQYHEARLTGTLMVVEKYKKAETEEEKHEIAQFYLNNLAGINNWDLVDSSSHYILGDYCLLNNNYTALIELAQSDNLWEQRIGIMSTFAFVKALWYEPTMEISNILLQHPHDLIHKAVGWMLREIGNRDLAVEEEYLKNRYKIMPRTMLRYAIEKFPETKRKAYLKGEIL